MSKKFRRQGSQEKKIDGSSWRRPKGKNSSRKLGKKGKGKKPSPGYGSPNRGMHPSGYYEVLVRNMDDLEDIDGEEEAARISSRVGKRKEEKIREKAEEGGIKVLN